MSESRLVWLRGELVPVEDAKVSILSPTSQYGANVFEGIRCYWNNGEEQLYGFRLREHLERLQQSIKLMKFESGYKVEFLEAAFRKVVRANGFREDIAVRQTVFLDGEGSWSAMGPTEMVIAPIRKGRHLDKDRVGVQCCISSWERISDRSLSPRVKVGANYMSGRMAQIEALENGYDTAIMLNSAGKVAEAPGACLFIVRSGVLITPPVTASILESITRASIISLATELLDIPAVERDIDRTELYIADEILLCGTAVEIVPVVNVDRFTVGTGRIGPITERLQTLYFAIARGEVCNYSHWLTPLYESGLPASVVKRSI